MTNTKDPKTEWLERAYPLWFKVVKGNPYGLPIGKVMRGRRKEGNVLLPIELYGDQLYHMASKEVEEVKS